MISYSFDSLSVEILMKIFIYLDVPSLCRMKQTCKRIHNIIETWAHYLINIRSLLVTNQAQIAMLNRSNQLLTPWEKIRISKNWLNGIYEETSLVSTKVLYIPWLQLSSERLWVSRASYITGYRRKFNKISKVAEFNLIGKSDSKICKFVYKNNCILTGQLDGSMWMWSYPKKRFIFDKRYCHDDYINSVDISDNIVISGSKDCCVKIWQWNKFQLIHTIRLRDRVWSLGISDYEPSLLAIGTASSLTDKPLQIYDLEKSQMILQTGTTFFGDGIIDIIWENGSTFWTSSNDSNIRRWDLRTGKYVQSLQDPFGSTIYCFEYDRENTIISGTQSHGAVILWDVRQKTPVKMYYMGSCNDQSSPVYSLSFDAEQLFTITHQHLNILDFSVILN